MPPRALLPIAATIIAVAFSSFSRAQEAPGSRLAPPNALQGGFSPTAPQSAVAQPATSQPGTTPTLDPWRSFTPVSPGVTTGNVTFLPSVTAGAFFDDNVFATHSNRQGSWGALVRPELGVRSSGPNYATEARGFIEQRWYDRFSSEDQLDGAAAVATTLMPDPDTQIVLKTGYARAHEARGTGESSFIGFDRPVGFDTYTASGALNKRFNRWWTSLGAAGSWQHYDTPTVGGVPVDQSYRDGVVSVVSGRLGYVVAPLTSVFVQGSGNQRDFHVDAFDSDGYRVVGGVLLEQGPGARIKGEAYAGYMYQNYTGATFNTVSTFTYGGTLAWLIAPRWTAVAAGRRDALESNLNGGVSVVESELDGRIDYQLLPNLIVGAGASWIADEYNGAGRTDYSLSPLVSVKYLAGPNVTLGFDYRNVSFDSSGTGVSTYYRNVYLFSINARL